MESSFWDGLRPSGVPDYIDFNQYKSIVDIINESVVLHAKKTAYTSINHSMTYQQLDILSRNFAAYIQHNTTLKPGDRIAIQLPNTLQYPIVLFAAFRAGLIVVNTNPLYTSYEMLHQFKDAQIKALVYMDLFGDKVEKVIKEFPIDVLIQTSLGDMLPIPKRQIVNLSVKHIKKMIPKFEIKKSIHFLSVLKEGRKHNCQFIKNDDLDSVVMLQYTGGTTGVAKGAMLTQRGLIANMLQVEALYKQCDSNGVPLHNPGNEISVAPLPLYHIYGFTVHILTQISSGNHSILISNPRDTDMMIRMSRKQKFTSITGINTLFVNLMAHPSFKKCDFSHLKTTISGGTALSEDTHQKWQQLTQCDISEGYGLTECSPIVSMNPPGEYAKSGTVGMPMPGTSLKVIDMNGSELPIGESGELCVKGPQVMKGYWRCEDETKNVIDKDGWLRTGDIAIIDEQGYVSIVDRLKDIILVSGFNVYPNDIENVVNSHPLVELSAVIGVKDQKSGEVPKLFVVRKTQELTKETLKLYCKDHLTAYKQPKVIEFRDQLPMSPVGKILRKNLH